MSPTTAVPQRDRLARSPPSIASRISAAARIRTARAAPPSRRGSRSTNSRRRRHLVAQVRQLEVGVRVDQAGQDRDVAEIDVGAPRSRGRRSAPAGRRRRCGRRSTATQPSRIGGSAIGSTHGGVIADQLRDDAELLCRRGCAPDSSAAPSGTLRVAVFARGGELEHPRHVALAEDRIAEDLVVHVAALRRRSRRPRCCGRSRLRPCSSWRRRRGRRSPRSSRCPCRWRRRRGSAARPCRPASPTTPAGCRSCRARCARCASVRR